MAAVREDEEDFTLQHFNTAPGLPQTKEDVFKLSDMGLKEFMEMCEAEPADPDNCLACCAYVLYQMRVVRIPLPAAKSRLVLEGNAVVENPDNGMARYIEVEPEGEGTVFARIHTWGQHEATQPFVDAAEAGKRIRVTIEIVDG